MKIAVDSSGSPWVVNSYGNIFRRANNTWQAMPGLAKDISVGNDGSVWVIGANPVAGGYGIYKWNGVSWNGVDGGATGIAVASNGRPLVVNSYGNIFFQSGASIVASHADFAGNSLQTARNINIPIQSFASAISGSIIQSDWVGTYDTNDYYRFSLNTRSQFDLKLDGLTADADVQLLNSNGVVIAQSTRSDAISESIVRDLDVGTYYIRVFAYGSNSTKYDLVTYAKSLVSIPSSNWKAEFFNNFDRVGTPVLVQDWGSGSQNFKYDWGSGSPMAGVVNSDNFSARVTTQRYFAAGTYQIQTTSDDGVRVRIGNQTIIDKWIDQGSTNHYGSFTTTTGEYFNLDLAPFKKGVAKRAKV